jgi:hypothetical protein
MVMQLQCNFELILVANKAVMAKVSISGFASGARLL